MSKQTISTTGPILSKEAVVAPGPVAGRADGLVSGILDSSANVITSLGNSVSSIITAENTTIEKRDINLNSNENKSISFVQIKSLGIALAAVALIVAIVVIVRKK